jgi:hypothetical protein
VAWRAYGLPENCDGMRADSWMMRCVLPQLPVWSSLMRQLCRTIRLAGRCCARGAGLCLRH